MTKVGTSNNPLRVAIVGSGPAGFYAAEHLFKQNKVVVEVDMYDRLPTPHGLVRSGVAPDHQKIKSVTRVYDKIALNPKFRFYGYVEFGKHINLDDLKKHYHQIVFATGAQTDRRMNIPGEDFKGSHAATEFVAWYNGHPDYRDFEFDLSQESAAVVGVGNVAIDVARILCLTEEELRRTDIADYALEALSKSRVRNIYILGRRGPAQAAFTNPEIKELGNLADTDVITLPEEVELDEVTRQSLEQNNDHSTKRKVEILQGYAIKKASEKSRRLHLRFLVSPVELVGDEGGCVKALRLVKNELYSAEDGSIRARAMDQFEELSAGLVFRSIGYHGVPLPGVPFNERWGVALNHQGRVIAPDTKKPVPGLYVTGWVKRGPTGVIGTNKTDSGETVNCMLEDVVNGAIFDPSHPEAASIENLIRERQPSFVSYSDWLNLDKQELARGEAEGRPRVKYTSIAEILEALRR
ncbi:MAG TPA: FAD-dependent oxidoreductase [Thermodesulfobacteriota bacterium]|nr:FAD-dependent oxidoreductase [Thermodesulfobacteriota bacterium]